MRGPFLFIGERRSDLAVRMGVTWEDGRLAAKQLFDGLTANGIDPKKHCEFINYFEWTDMPQRLNWWINRKYELVAMGRKVEAELLKHAIKHIAIVHPASRGTIRKKANYIAHIKEKLAA